MTDDRLVVMGKRELVSSAETSRAQGVVLGMFERTDVYWRIRTVNVNRRRGWI